MNFKEESDFTVNSSSLKEIRNFARELFEKVEELNDYKEELVLALAEAAQNVVKHGYNNQPTQDEMKIIIKFEDNVLSMEP